MKGDDDDDDQDTSIGIGRFPVMPSLVALQQMRNRLQLAHLGKKLMKWTALALGKELRTVAMEIDKVMRGLEQEYRDAFISVARGRYFYPQLNEIVLNDVMRPPQEALVKVQTTVKSVVACKIHSFEVTQLPERPYQYLAMDRGGMHLLETRRIWYELLKKLVRIAELKNAFVAEEFQHKSATKRQNALSKIVIPRIQSTIRYIILELEELGREDFYRIKLIKQRKRRDADALRELERLADLKASGLEDTTKLAEPASEAELKEATPLSTTEEETPQGLTDETPQGLKEESLVKPKQMDPDEPAPSELTPAQMLEYLKCTDEKMHEILDASRSILVKGASPEKIDSFLEQAKEVRMYTKRVANNRQTSPAVRERLDGLVQQLTHAIDGANDIKKQLKDDGPEPPQPASLDSRGKPPIYQDASEPAPTLKHMDTETTDELAAADPQSNVKYLKSHLDDVDKLITSQKELGLATPSMEKFQTTCREVREKLDSEEKNPEVTEMMDSEEKNPDAKRAKNLCPNLQQECPSWVVAYINDKRNSKVNSSKRNPAVRNADKSLDDTVKLITRFADEGLVTDSVQKFLDDYGATRGDEGDEETKACCEADDKCPDECGCDSSAKDVVKPPDNSRKNSKKEVIL